MIFPPNLSINLRKGGGERGAVAQAAAATAGEATVGAILGSRLRSGGTVEEFVVGYARVSGRADEDTAVHIRGALGTDDAHRVAAHVDLARDIDDAYGAHGVLAPGVDDLAVVRGRVGVDGRPSANGARGKADDLASASGEV
jgi:hypothetical protein